MSDLISIGKVAKALGVSPQTVRNWEKSGFLKSYRTPNNHRRYKLPEVKQMLNDFFSNEDKKDEFLKSLESPEEIKKLEDSIAKAVQYGNAFMSPAYKGFIGRDNPNKEGVLIGSNPSILLDSLNKRKFSIIDRMQAQARTEIMETEFLLTLNSAKLIKTSINFLQLEELYSTYFTPTKDSVISFNPIIFGVEMKEPEFISKADFITNPEVVKTGLIAKVGNINIYINRKLDPNIALLHCNTDEVKISEPTVKIKLDNEKFSFRVEEYFKPSENSIAIQFFNLPINWKTINLNKEPADPDFWDLAEYYKKVRSS